LTPKACGRRLMDAARQGLTAKFVLFPERAHKPCAG